MRLKDQFLSQLLAEPGSHSRRWRLAVVFVSTGIASAINLFLKTGYDAASTPLFLAAIIISTWFGGLSYGLLATAVSGVLTAYLVMEPHFSLFLGVVGMIRLACFVLTALLISSLMSRTARSRDEVANLNDELERRVEGRTEELEKAKRQLEAFCYTMAHDLRAPLRSMQGFARALLDEHQGQLDATGKDFAGRIVISSQKMDRLIQDLLAYTDLSHREMQFETVLLDRLTKIVIDSFEYEIEQRNAEVSIASPLPPVSGHPATVEMILANLISNALRFSDPARLPRIRIFAERKDEKIRLWVEDNGVGVDTAYREKIFQVFERLSPTDVYASTGIGLAMVKAGIERMGGSVGMESNPGGGSRFWVEFLPAKSPAPAKASLPVASPSKPVPAEPFFVLNQPAYSDRRR